MRKKPQSIEKSASELPLTPLVPWNHASDDAECPTARRDDRTAGDVPSLRESLRGFKPDELRRVPIAPLGARLCEGSAYFDLVKQREFRACGETLVGAGEFFVPKALIDYRLWNRLCTMHGGQKPARDLRELH